eukprot:CAMPEP_0113937388 /NCGR_PEP_ID=MMETSP1339-20121228/4012_1 /TAXON_ID=94617 /ORGANISM="Fibrocapsa japonica" /LENGTH=187 /DNA_ID=CAMNT_0000940119 /DNA_START=18 /DNA_END=581 /DNA_ORIENTATION=- /assembly_acc=CAM_ASM_000762
MADIIEIGADGSFEIPSAKQVPEKTRKPEICQAPPPSNASQASKIDPPVNRNTPVKSNANMQSLERQLFRECPKGKSFCPSFKIFGAICSEGLQIEVLLPPALVAHVEHLEVDLSSHHMTLRSPSGKNSNTENEGRWCGVVGGIQLPPVYLHVTLPKAVDVERSRAFTRKDSNGDAYLIIECAASSE